MEHTIEFVDIVSKPVGGSYENVYTLGIYCWQQEKKEKQPAFFLPRLSYEQNKEYINQVFPHCTKNLDGKGVFLSIWKIEKYYEGVSLENADKVLRNDIAALSAFKAWVQADGNLQADTKLQMYVLGNERNFSEPKYTETQNHTGTVYYDWDEILGKTEIERKQAID